MIKEELRQSILAYLIFVSNAGNAVSVNFLAECEKKSEKWENYCFGLSESVKKITNIRYASSPLP